MDALLKLLSENSNFSTDELAIMLNEQRIILKNRFKNMRQARLLKATVRLSIGKKLQMRALRP